MIASIDRVSYPIAATQPVLSRDETNNSVPPAPSGDLPLIDEINTACVTRGGAGVDLG